MNSQEVREYISQQSGVPADLLTGQTPEKILQQAREVLNLRRDRMDLDQRQDGNKTTREQFAEWANVPEQEMEHEEDMTARDLFMTWMDGPDEEKRQPDPPAYPELKDGEPQDMPTLNQPIREIFAEAFSDPGTWGFGKW